MIICWKVQSQHISYNTTLLRYMSARFGNRGRTRPSSGSGGKVGEASEMDLKYVTNSEH